MDKNKLKMIINDKIGEPDWRSRTIKELLSLKEKQFSSELKAEEIASLLEYVSTER